MITTLDLVASFRDEVSEQLDELAQAIESLATVDGPARQATLAKCRQLAHNIKGISATVGLETLTSITHAFESVLRRLDREGDQQARPPVGLLLRGITSMQRLSEGDFRPDECLSLVERLREHCLETDRPTIDRAVDALAASASSASKDAAEGSAQAAHADSGKKGTDAGESTGASSVRVDTARLDRAMAYAGELLVTHARLAARNEKVEGICHTLQSVFSKLDGNARADLAPLVTQLERLLQSDRKEQLHFGNLSQSLNAAMKQVRMMPLAGLAAAWRRVVREAAQELGKLIDLQVEVGDIELDRFVLERIRDPMIHILRNAVAHGIENAEDRALEGKRPAGQVVIRAGMQGSMVALDISDDGAGFNPDRIAQAAIRKGLRTAAQLERCTRGQIIALIFEPGFSTSETAGMVSGRGVGLDVVRQNVEELHGSVTVMDRSPGGGATFRLMLPVSVLSNKGLLVRARKTIYALPIEHVMGTLRIERNQIRQVEGVSVVRHEKDEPLPIRSLAATMQSQGDRDAEPGKLKVVCLAVGSERLGVVVDDVLRDEEFVVKKLPWNLAAIPGVNGAVILADGSLAVVVDVPWLFRMNSAAAVSVPGAASMQAGPSRARRRVLLVDDSVTSRALERSMLSAAGYDVTLATNGVEAWALLQQDPFDVVVSDVMMPEMDGFELTTRIRKSDRLKTLPVILVTSLGKEEDIAAGAAAGADEYLVKGQLEQHKLVEAVARYS